MRLVYNQALTERIQTLYDNIYDVYEWYDGPSLFEFTDTRDSHWVAKWLKRVDATEYYVIMPGEGANAFTSDSYVDYVACVTGLRIVGYFNHDEDT